MRRWKALKQMRTQSRMPNAGVQRQNQYRGLNMAGNSSSGMAQQEAFVDKCCCARDEPEKEGARDTEGGGKREGDEEEEQRERRRLEEEEEKVSKVCREESRKAKALPSSFSLGGRARKED